MDLKKLKSSTTQKFIDDINDNFDTLNKQIYPVGSVYIANSSSTNPSKIFGGTWQLYDKEFANKRISYQNKASGIATYVEAQSVIVDDLTIELRNHCITFSVTSNTDSDLPETNSDNDLLLFKLPKIGISDGSIPIKDKYFTGVGDDGELITMLRILYVTNYANANYIAVRLLDFLSRSTDYVSGSTLTNGAPIDFCITIELLPANMLDSFCDKFYWKRTA